MGAIKSAQTNLRTDLCWLGLHNNATQQVEYQSSANAIDHAINQKKANP